MMTEEEKNTPITFEMLGSMLKGIEEALTPQINALGDTADKRWDSYEKPILSLADTCNRTIEVLNILRAFVIAAYADSKNKEEASAAKLCCKILGLIDLARK